MNYATEKRLVREFKTLLEHKLGEERPEVTVGLKHWSGITFLAVQVYDRYVLDVDLTSLYDSTKGEDIRDAMVLAVNDAYHSMIKSLVYYARSMNENMKHEVEYKQQYWDETSKLRRELDTLKAQQQKSA